jgi:hypothetical protein
MAIGMMRGTMSRGNDFKLPAIERMGGIGYLEDGVAIVGAVRVVEQGINTRYRSIGSCMRSNCRALLPEPQIPSNAENVHNHAQFETSARSRDFTPPRHKNSPTPSEACSAIG